MSVCVHVCRKSVWKSENHIVETEFLPLWRESEEVRQQARKGGVKLCVSPSTLHTFSLLHLVWQNQVMKL